MFVIILHGISAPFYVLHTTLPLQYNDSIFNMDFDEEEEEEEVQVTTLGPMGNMTTNETVGEFGLIILSRFTDLYTVCSIQSTLLP